MGPFLSLVCDYSLLKKLAVDVRWCCVQITTDSVNMDLLYKKYSGISPDLKDTNENPPEKLASSSVWWAAQRCRMVGKQDSVN